MRNRSVAIVVPIASRIASRRVYCLRCVLVSLPSPRAPLSISARSLVGTRSAEAKVSKFEAVQAKRAAKVLLDEGWLKQEAMPPCTSELAHPRMHRM